MTHHFHAGVWIDHRHACGYGLDRERVNSQIIGPRTRGVEALDRMSRGRTATIARKFLEQVGLTAPPLRAEELPI